MFRNLIPWLVLIGIFLVFSGAIDGLITNDNHLLEIGTVVTFCAIILKKIFLPRVKSPFHRRAGI